MPRQPDKSVASSACTWLRVRKVGRRLTQIYDQELQPFGLTVAQYSLLGYLKTYDGISISALAEKMIMDPSTLTRNLRPIEGNGLVALARDPRDRRSRRLHLTEKGRQVHLEAKPAWARAQRRIESALGDKDVSVLNLSLDRVIARLPE